MPEVAPPMFVQPVPSVAQSCHWYAYEVGLKLHDPFVVDRTLPVATVPDTTGSTVLTGALPPPPHAGVV